MAPLKLFISHSSRLDDVPHKYTDDDANWRLLRETCDGLKARYGDAIHILVDRDGLIPGDDWNRELNLWLAECQAAIILVSKRALEKSDWVAKEAAILTWRRVLDRGFELIPITIEGESSVSDLAQGFWGSLDMWRTQSIHANRRDVSAILDCVARRFGKDQEALARRYPRFLTPLDHLRGAIAKMLADTATEDALAAVLGDLNADFSEVTRVGLAAKDRYADHIAQCLLRTSAHDVWSCFETFRKVLAHLPLLSFEQKRMLLEYVRPLWVHPAAAFHLCTAMETKTALALCGSYVNVPGPNKYSQAYTFERYVERAWYLSESNSESKPCAVHLTRDNTPPEQIRAMIAEKVLRGHPNPGSPGAKKALDRETIVLFIPAPEDFGGAPDPTTLSVFTDLARSYAKLVLVFACCGPEDTFPEGLSPITPLLDRQLEDDAYSAECAETAYLARTDSDGRQP